MTEEAKAILEQIFMQFFREPLSYGHEVITYKEKKSEERKGKY